MLDDENTDVSWDRVCEVALSAGQESLGLVQRNHRNNWFDAECREAAERRKTYRLKWIQDRENERKRQNFREARGIAVSTNRRKKRQALNKELDDIENSRERGQARAQYQGINQIRKGYQPRQELIEDKEGNMLVTRDAIKDRWVEHFQELLNRPEPERLPNIEVEGETPQEREELPTREEILREIRNLKNSKASGIDGAMRS